MGPGVEARLAAIVFGICALCYRRISSSTHWIQQERGPWGLSSDKALFLGLLLFVSPKSAARGAVAQQRPCAHWGRRNSLGQSSPGRSAWRRTLTDSESP